MSSKKKTVPLTFDLFFDPKQEKDDITGLLSGFTKKEEEYWYCDFDASFGAGEVRQPMMFLNPEKITKEEFFKVNPHVHPSRVLYVTEEEFRHFQEQLRYIAFGEGKCIDGKVTLSIKTVNPSGPIEVSE